MFESFDNLLCDFGDFNANNNNLFGDLLKNFCLDHDLIISDQHVAVIYRYVHVPVGVTKNVAVIYC